MMKCIFKSPIWKLLSLAFIVIAITTEGSFAQSLTNRTMPSLEEFKKSLPSSEELLSNPDEYAVQPDAIHQTIQPHINNVANNIMSKPVSSVEEFQENQKEAIEFKNHFAPKVKIAGNPYERTESVTDKLTNASCRIDELHKEYMSTCYSCIVVSALIGVFMQVVDQLEPLMQLAGLKLLVLAMLLWFPYFVLKKVMSMVSVEPMEMLQELFQFLFKCLVAYALITSGIKIVSQLMVNPLLGAGADYGISIIDSVMPKTVKATDKLSNDSKQYKITSSNNLDSKVFDKIMQISKKADAAVSLNFVIGNALVCHSHNAGALVSFDKRSEIIDLKFVIPDFWIMLCGACIWIFALFVTFAVNFYLLDLSFKIGFALLALPVTLGLWPISKLEGLCIKCLKVIVNAAGTFMFLGITTGFSIALINASIGGTDNLLTYIKNNDQVSVSRVFGFTSGAFLLVVFAFYYSYKLISGTVEKFADKLFSCDFSGMTPMHHKAVGFVSMGGSAASNLGSWAHRKTTQKAFNAVGNKVNNMAKNTARSAIGGVRKGINKLRGR